MEYLFEMHSHTKEVSTCAVSYAPDMIELYSKTDYYGIVSTNHMHRGTFKRVGLENASWNEKIDHFLKGYNALRELSSNRFVVLLGMEICFDSSPNDYLVYGITEEFLRSNGDLMALTPEEFSHLAHKNNLLFIQAHPFRRDLQIEDWRILDGYEVYNGNPRHQSSNEVAEHWANYHHKMMVSGSDFHEEDDVGRGGIYFINPITDNEDLLRELRSGNYRLKKS